MSSSTSHMSMLSYAIALLVVMTAAIHLYLSSQFPQPPDLIFLLNGLGYLGLLVALYFPHRRLLAVRKRIRWILIAYTTLTVVLWIFLGVRTPLGYFDKVIEIMLIGLLWLENGRPQPAADRP